MLPHLQVDELVGYNAHPLQRKRLHSRPWEALNDPTLALLLVALDLFFNEVDHDVVVN